MEQKPRNIYENARRTAGLTQERWAEAIGCSVDSIRLYESERGLPSDEIVTKMVEVAGLPVLGYWHLCNKSRVAADILPDVRECSLPLAVVQLIKRINDFADLHRTDDLLDIAEDGAIDDRERGTFDAIVRELEGIVQASMQLKYAKEERPTGE